jgi:hypothetical protein
MSLIMAQALKYQALRPHIVGGNTFAALLSVASIYSALSPRICYHFGIDLNTLNIVCRSPFWCFAQSLVLFGRQIDDAVLKSTCDSLVCLRELSLDCSASTEAVMAVATANRRTLESCSISLNSPNVRRTALQLFLLDPKNGMKESLRLDVLSFLLSYGMSHSDRTPRLGGPDNTAEDYADAGLFEVLFDTLALPARQISTPKPWCLSLELLAKMVWLLPNLQLPLSVVQRVVAVVQEKLDVVETVFSAAILLSSVLSRIHIQERQHDLLEHEQDILTCVSDVLFVASLALKNLIDAHLARHQQPEAQNDDDEAARRRAEMLFSSLNSDKTVTALFAVAMSASRIHKGLDRAASLATGAQLETRRCRCRRRRCAAAAATRLESTKQGARASRERAVRHASRCIVGPSELSVECGGAAFCACRAIMEAAAWEERGLFAGDNVPAARFLRNRRLRVGTTVHLDRC